MIEKSQEIEELKAQLADGEEKRQGLLDRIARLEADKIVSVNGHARSRERSSSIVDDDGREAAHEALQAQAEAWREERESLLAEISLLKIAKTDAEESRELFRTSYNSASAFTVELRRENEELKAQVVVAEGQASKGVLLVRSQFEAQLRKAHDELDKSQKLVHVLLEKDRLTDDDVRKKAAEEPGLLAMISDLQEKIRETKGEVFTLVKQRNTLLVSNNEINSELSSLRAEHLRTRSDVRRMRVEIDRYGARERSIKRMIHLSTPPENDADADGELEDPGEEEVYVCSWAINDNAERCGELLSSRQVSCIIRPLPRFVH